MAAKQYDPTLKDLVEADPDSWPALVRSPRGPTEVIDADISTVSGAADKVLRVTAAFSYILHLEFVTGHDALELPPKLAIRNGLLDDRHHLPIRSVVVLMRPDSDTPRLTGKYQRAFPDEEPYFTFRYPVVRLWQLAPEPLLTGGVGLLPLALLSAVTEADLPGIIRRIEQRLSSRRVKKMAPKLLAAAYILAGLRYSEALVEQLFRGVISMKESSTYQAILREGRDEGRNEGRTEGALSEAKKVLRLQGEEAFGVPDARTIELIERLDDLPRLEELLKKVLTAQSWQGLFGQTTSRRRTKPASSR